MLALLMQKTVTRWLRRLRMRRLFSILCVGTVLVINTTAVLGASPDEEMHANITVTMSWDKQFDRTHETGSATLRVTGKIKLANEESEFLQYEPQNLTATYDFEFTRVMTDPGDECFGKKILHETGSGGGTPQLDFQAMLGSMGQMHLIQYQATSGGGFDVGRMMSMGMGGGDGFDAYTFMLVAPGVVKTTERRMCPGSETRTIPRTAVFQMRCKELTSRAPSGSYKWASDVDWSPGQTPPMEVFVGSCDGTDFFGPAKGGGDVSYSVSWDFGEPKPIVKILWEDDDITDEEADVLIGRKVRLKAKPLPEGLSISNVNWEVDRDLVMAGYTSNSGNAAVVPFSKDAFNQPELEVFFRKGSLEGLEAKVKVSGKVDGSDVEAETTIKVFQPEIGSSDIRPYGSVTLGPHADGECHLYLGSVSANRDGMDIEQAIVMPWVDEDQHLLQYVQRIKEDLLEYRGESFIQQKNDEWCLDTYYPANQRPPTPREARFLDSPGPPVLPRSTKEIHVHDQFETYLMFKPSSNPEDPDAIWVPIEVQRWDWAAGAECDTSQSSPPCAWGTCSPLYTIVPIPAPEPWPDHPVWSCNVKNNPRVTVGYDYREDDRKEWEEEFNRRRQGGQEGL
jgi:hypothetical protein